MDMEYLWLIFTITLYVTHHYVYFISEKTEVYGY